MPKYQVKKVLNYIQVNNLEKEQLEGYWNQEKKRWFDVQEFIEED